MMSENQVDSFGYLSEKLDFLFDGGSVTTKGDSVEVRKWINSQTNRDGYLYPSTSYTIKRDIRSKQWRRIPKTNRPAKYFHMPPSHNIFLNDQSDQILCRYGLAGFVVHSLAFLFGTKLQFWDWFIEGRIPTRRQTINIALVPSDVQTFFGRAVPVWQGYSDLNKKRMVNLLFVHSIAGALEWDWQQLQTEYMVTDACYSVANDIGKCKASGHKARLIALSDAFGLAKNEKWFKLIVDLRNHLFHETLWDGGSPFSPRSPDSLFAPLHLRRFNHRLITALLYGPCKYTKTSWTSIGTYAFSIN